MKLKKSNCDETLKLKYFNTIYPKDLRKVPYPLETLKCYHALTSWTCADFLKLDNSLGQVVSQSKKIPTSQTRLDVRAFQSC